MMTVMMITMTDYKVMILMVVMMTVIMIAITVIIK
jgi:hypothetical protein